MSEIDAVGPVTWATRPCETDVAGDRADRSYVGCTCRRMSEAFPRPARRAALKRSVGRGGQAKPLPRGLVGESSSSNTVSSSHCLLVKPDRQIASAAQPLVIFWNEAKASSLNQKGTDATFRPIANVVLLLLRVLVLAALGILHGRTYLGPTIDHRILLIRSASGPTASSLNNAFRRCGAPLSTQTAHGSAIPLSVCRELVHHPQPGPFQSPCLNRPVGRQAYRGPSSSLPPRQTRPPPRRRSPSLYSAQWYFFWRACTGCA